MSFWVRFNSKNPSKRGLFDQKMGFYSRKSPKTGLLKRGEVIFKSGAILERIRYLIRTFIHFNWPVDYCFALVANWNSSQLKASASSRAEAKGWNAALAQPQSYLTARQPKERIHWSGRRNKQKVKIIKE